MKEKLKTRPISIRLTEYQTKRMAIACEQFNASKTEVITKAIDASMDKMFDDYPQLKLKIK